MSYAVLYKANETDFNTLGLGVLRDAISPLVTEERNGQFEFSMSYPVDGALFDEIKNDRIIKADASQKLKAQRFKIIRITKPAGGIVKVYAEHVSYLSQDLALKPSVSYNGNATQALTAWKNNIVDEHPFTIFSDIQTTGSGVWTIDKVENARRALGGVAGSILDTYGGEYRFDNYHIGLYANRGSDSGALIAYGKNLTDIEQEEEIANTYTSIYPYTNIRDEEGNESLLTLPEYFVDSEYTSNYARRKIKTINFQQDDITTVEQLRERAEQYIADNDIGVPSVNLTVKFVDLSKTLDYKDLALVEEINLCDQVTVYYEKLGIRQKAKVIKTIWNVALDRYEELVIGKAKANLSQSIGTTVDGKLETVVTDLNSVRISADGKTKIFTGINEPIATNINDLWYKPVEDGGVEMYRWDGIIWALQKSSAGALAGTIDFANIQAINIDANAITTGTLSGTNMWLNLVTGEMQFTNHTTGDVLVLNQGEIFFQNGDNTRHLRYSPQGLIMEPGAGNTGTALNTGFILVGPDGSHKYIDFRNTDLETTQRLVGINETIRTHTKGRFEIRKNVAFNGTDAYNGVRAIGYFIGDGTEGLWYGGDGVAVVEGYNMIDFRIRGVGVMQIYENGIECWGEMYMNGHTIWDESDLTLKTKILPTAIDAIAETKKQKVIEFEWDKSNPHNEGKPEGTQFGLSAQHSGILQLTPEETGKGYMGVNLIKEIHLATLTNQKLIKRLEALEARVAALEN